MRAWCQGASQLLEGKVIVSAVLIPLFTGVQADDLLGTNPHLWIADPASHMIAMSIRILKTFIVLRPLNRCNCRHAGCQHIQQKGEPHLHLIMLVAARQAGESAMAAISSLILSACLDWQQVHLLYCSQTGRPPTLPGSLSKVPCTMLVALWLPPLRLEYLNQSQLSKIMLLTCSWHVAGSSSPLTKPTSHNKHMDAMRAPMPCLLTDRPD